MNSKVKNNILNDTDCLSADQLFRYSRNKLTPEEKYEAECHLIDCALCTEALEGIALVSSPAVLDQMNADVKKLIQKNASGGVSVQPKQYWLAAASISAIVILSVYLYSEYKQARHPDVALRHEPVQLPTPQQAVSKFAEPNPTEKASIASEQSVTLPAENGSKNAEPSSVSNAIAGADEVQADESTIEPSVEENAPDNTSPQPIVQLSLGKQYSPAYTNQSAYPAIPQSKHIVKASKESDSEKMELAETTSANTSADLFTSASGAATAGNITYIQNLKVIDYVYSNNTLLKDVPASQNYVDPSYENKQKKELEAKSSDALTRKVSYLDLLSTPINNYKNKNYKSAVSGFNELLRMFPEDQNAYFYKGMSYYYLGDYTNAIASLSQPANDTGCTFNEEARFYMAKSYLATGKTSIATDLFDSLAAGNGFYKNLSQEELKRIRQ
ncbi:MAG TPA: tetratricopeptide repeat protein [Bacteroidia bacterium]|nr:tetratricopeptide repeat protein [Bacteroidia bacterium]